MRRPSTFPAMTVEDYLAVDDDAPDLRYEFVQGHVYAMAGGTLRHSRIGVNLCVALEARTDGTGCTLFAENARLRVASDVFYYPDLFVTCQPVDPNATTATDACLVVEIVSDGSARTDHGEKRQHYQALPSLQAYLIVEQERRMVTVVRRGPGGTWRREIVTDLQAEGRIELSCPPATLTLDEIYRRTDTPGAPPLRRIHEPAAAPFGG